MQSVKQKIDEYGQNWITRLDRMMMNVDESILKHYTTIIH
jgi:hypothetical protein